MRDSANPSEPREPPRAAIAQQTARGAHTARPTRPRRRAAVEKLRFLDPAALLPSPSKTGACTCLSSQGPTLPAGNDELGEGSSQSNPEQNTRNHGARFLSVLNTAYSSSTEPLQSVH